MQSLLIEIKNGEKVHGHLDSRFVLSIPTLQIRQGEVCIVSGRSGCGKTTLLDLLGCMAEFDQCEKFSYHFPEGTQQVNKAGAMKRAAIRRRHLSYVLQQDGLLSYLTAWENICLAMKMSGRLKWKKDALDMAHAMGVVEQLKKYPPALSIGQRQRIAIIRALATRVSLILADEPTGALDPLTATTIRSELLRAVRESGASLLVVTHDLPLFESVGDRFFGFELSHYDKTVFSTLVETSCYCS